MPLQRQQIWHGTIPKYREEIFQRQHSQKQRHKKHHCHKNFQSFLFIFLDVSITQYALRREGTHIPT